MKPLQKEFTKRGWRHKQAYRDSNGAVYEVSDGNGFSHFEVFEVRIQPASEWNGIKYEEKERYPSNEDFGKTAWTANDFERAMWRVGVIKETISKRESNNQ